MARTVNASADAPAARTAGTSAPRRTLGDVISDEIAPLRLPKGPHNLPASSVRASQRERLLTAAAALAAHHGANETTVPQIVAAARVSRNAFYDCFKDKTDCFVALADEIAAELLRELTALTSESDWLAALHRGVGIYLRFWQERPVMTRAYLIEMPAAGERAFAQREKTYAQFRMMFGDLAARARREQPDLPPLTDVELTAAVIAPTQLVTEHARAGRTDELVSLEDELTHLLVKLLADDATAARAAWREHG